MRSRNTLVIDGHQTVISDVPDINMFRGEFVGLNGGADFVAENVSRLIAEGKVSLREFLDVCRKRGIEPNRQYQGKPIVFPEALVRLSEVLERDIEFFIDPFVVEGEAAFSWRADDAVPSKDLERFEHRVGGWVGMLRFLRKWNAGAGGPFGMTLRLGKESSFEDALAMGEAVVGHLKLGAVPAARLVERVESSLDIPVLFIDAIKAPRGKVSGATCHLPDLGVILINRNEPEARRHYDLAHELFHALTWAEMAPAHRETPDGRKKGKEWRVEKLADNFAAGLLMPTASLERFIDRKRMADVEHLVEVANQLRVSPYALAFRLFNAKWIDESVRAALSHRTSGLSVSTPKRFSTQFVELLHQGIDRGQVSARKVAKTLGLTLAELVDLFAEHTDKPAPFAL